MIKQIAIAIVFFGLTGAVFAQDRQLTIEDAIMKQRDALAPATLKGLMWLPGTDLVSWKVDDDMTGGHLIIYDFKTKQETRITWQEMNIALANYRAVFAAPGENISDFKKFPNGTTWVSANELQVRVKERIYLYNYKDKTFTQENILPAGAASEDRHKTTANIAYTIDNNLFIKPRIGNAVAVTGDADKGIVNGQSVHRNEFGITKGTFWSNKGELLAYYRMDETMVTEATYYGFDSHPGKNTSYRYPMAGQTSHQVKLGVYNPTTKTTTFMQTGEPLEQYLTNITWSPDDKYIYIACVMREQDLMYLKRFEAATGKLDKILFEEKSNRYVEPENGPKFLPGDDNKFIWQSERDGYNHLYLYNTEGKLVRQLTKGNWVVTSLLGMDAKGKFAYFTATKKSPLDATLHAVEISSGKITDLSAQAGRHGISFNTSFTYYIDNLSSFEVPRNIAIKSTKDGKPVHELLNAPNPLTGYKLGKTEVITLRSSDNTTDLYSRIIKPVNFDSTRKYPVVVYVYGGPHIQMVTNGFLNGADLWMNYMAQKGYVVYTLDNRGSVNRGFEFESAIHRQVGTLELADQLVGVNYLKSQRFVDTNRMAIFGWSFGGFMTTTMMLKAPDAFKVGIAGGPVIDWNMYEVMYTERYMDAPIENPEGYKNNNLLNHAQNLKGKLMMIHGTSDDVVVWQHSLSFIKKAVELGKQMDYFVYPGHAHNVLGKDRVHLYQKVTDYIMNNIGYNGLDGLRN